MVAATPFPEYQITNHRTQPDQHPMTISISNSRLKSLFLDPTVDVRTHFSRLKPFDKHISPFVTRWTGRVDWLFMWRLRKILSEIAFWINGTRSRSAAWRTIATWYIPSVTTSFHRVSVSFYSRSQLTAGSHAASSPVAPPRFGLAGRARKDGKGRESGASHQPSLALRTRDQLSRVALQEPEKKRLWGRQGSHVRRKDKRQHKHKTYV